MSEKCFISQEAFDRELGLEEPELMEIAESFRINLFPFSDKTKIGKSADKLMESADDTLQRINVDGTRNLIALCSERNCWMI